MVNDRLLAVLLASLAISGCQVLGPATIRTGRGAYNDVIARTDSEQTLGMIVRTRYADPIGLLTVSAVTASLRFSAHAAGEVGIGADSAYAGNLVPFSAGVGYEDNPTISYLPVDAQAFLREWLTPAPLSLLVLAMQSGSETDALLALLVERMNALRAGESASPPERSAFDRAAKLLEDLRARGVLEWVEQSEHPGRYELIVSGYAPAHMVEVDELLALLDVRADTRRGSTLRIPVALGVQVGGFAGLAVQTRSTADIIRSAAARVEVPEEHVAAGVVGPNLPESARDSGELRVRSSRKAPRNASLAVRHRGWWYYVDDADFASKRSFQGVQMVFLSRLSQATRGQQTSPVLTIPVR